MSKLIRETFVNEKGAASVLIIFVLLVLVTLGAFSITSASANYRLSRKTIEWNLMYYELDAQGEEFLCALDGKLAEAEKSAYEYMINRGYSHEWQEGITEEVQAEIASLYSNNDLTETEIMNIIYMYYADILVRELEPAFQRIEVYPVGDGAFTDSLLVNISFASNTEGYELCGLNVSVWVDPVEYSAKDTSAGLTLVRLNSNSRYRIEDWYEYQEQLQDETEPEPAFELWDGSL